MIARLIGIAAVTLTLAACAHQPAPRKALAEDPYALAKGQALALGRVLGGVQACEGDAWKPPFHEFIAAKREQGLTDAQAATIAALVGVAKGEPEMFECSPEGRSRRVAAIDGMRVQW
jgi:hypothetical protein